MSLNAIHCYAIITEDEDVAQWAFAEIGKAYEPHWGKVVLDESHTKRRHYVRFENGNTLRWIRPRQELRGYRFHGLFIDHRLSIELIKSKILPYMRCSVDDIAWF